MTAPSKVSRSSTPAGAALRGSLTVGGASTEGVGVTGDESSVAAGVTRTVGPTPTGAGCSSGRESLGPTMTRTIRTFTTTIRRMRSAWARQVGLLSQLSNIATRPRTS